MVRICQYLVRLLVALGLTSAVLMVKPVLEVAAARAIDWTVEQREQIWHVDPLAGVRVRIPWERASSKNAKQLNALIQHQRGDLAGDTRRFTSAVYAASGSPFLVIWTRRDLVPPTQRQLLDLSTAESWSGVTGLVFDQAKLQGHGQLLESIGSALQARVLFQIARGETVFMAYFYQAPEDAERFEGLRRSFELSPERRLSWQALPTGRSLWLSWLGGLGILAGFTVLGHIAIPMRRPPGAATHVLLALYSNLLRYSAAHLRKLGRKLKPLAYRRRQP